MINQPRGIVAAWGVAFLTLASAASAGTSSEPAVPQAVVGNGSPAAQAQQGARPARVAVTLRGDTIAASPNRIVRGRTTLVVRNAGPDRVTFLIARHSGGVGSLPRWEGLYFVPAGEIAGRLGPMAPGAQKQLTLTLARGSYLLVESSVGRFVNAAMPLDVR